jgi:hypothetical protein
MRKLILILFLTGLAFGMKAQDRTTNMGTMDLNQTLLDYTGLVADTLTANQDTIRFSWRHKSHRPVLYNIKVQTAETSSITGDYDLVLYGKVYSDDSWTKITTTAGETSGGSYTFNSDESEVIDTIATTNAPFYRYFMVELDGSQATTLSAGKITLNSIYVKLYRR